jgi:hypothetical protein
MALTKISTQFISALGDGNVGQVLTADTNGDFYWKDSTALEVSAGNVSGTVPEAQVSATISASAQPNITSVGTLIELTVAGNVGVGNITGTDAVFTTIAGNVLTVKGFTETVASTINTGTSIAPNAAVSTIYNYTANNNFTFNGFTNPIAGQSMTVVIIQDGTGNRTMTSTMKFVGGNKTLSTAANSEDVICVFYTGLGYFASLTKNYY